MELLSKDYIFMKPRRNTNHTIYNPLIHNKIHKKFVKKPTGYQVILSKINIF